jgi:HSP20 family molecular chaperone IbpA
MTLSENRVPMTLRDSFFTDDFFKSSWDDFDSLRKEMMKESSEFWRKAEQEMNQMMSSSMSSSNMIQKESSSSSSANRSTDLAKTSDFTPWFFPRRWMLPRLFGETDILDSKMKTLDIFQDKDEQVIRMKDDDSKFEISLDTHGFRPDELKVNVSGNVLSIEAKHEEKGDNKYVAKQFSRSYTLPEGCEEHKVSSNLSSDGILMITAPKKQAIKHEGNRSIPVTHKK